MTESPERILKVDSLKMIQFNFGSNCPSGFRGDDFKKLTNRQTLDEQILVEKLKLITKNNSSIGCIINSFSGP